jgi:hypothetical protein
MRIFATLLILMAAWIPGGAQVINGMVRETGAAGGPLSDVQIVNVHTDQKVITGADGNFSIAALVGQLLEFRKPGYQTKWLRIETLGIKFYSMALESTVHELPGVSVRSFQTDFQKDSIKYHTLYKKQLNTDPVTGWRAVQSPFTALSRDNRNLIRFQHEFEFLEHMKFVDFTFNERVIRNLTGLAGDSAKAYIRVFRPSYEALRGMKDYDFYAYIKRTVEIWRQRQRFGPAGSRGGGGG